LYKFRCKYLRYIHLLSGLHDGGSCAVSAQGIDRHGCQNQACAEDGHKAGSFAQEEKDPDRVDYGLDIGDDGRNRRGKPGFHAAGKEKVAHAQEQAHGCRCQPAGNAAAGNRSIKRKAEDKQASEQITLIGIAEGVDAGHACGQENQRPGDGRSQAQRVAQKLAPCHALTEAECDAGHDQERGGDVDPARLLPQDEDLHQDDNSGHGILQHDSVGAAGQLVGAEEEHAGARNAQCAEPSPERMLGTETVADFSKQQNGDDGAEAHQGKGIPGRKLAQHAGKAPEDAGERDIERCAALTFVVHGIPAFPKLWFAYILTQGRGKVNAKCGFNADALDCGDG